MNAPPCLEALCRTEDAQVHDHTKMSWPNCSAVTSEYQVDSSRHRGRYHRLRVGRYRVVYSVDGDLITIDRVDRVATE
jgi:mRNA-degrading endonuclease RelE of RelBE toxin-antitoxin system